LRASQINGCGFCTDMHAKDALHAGESQERLNLVATWREAKVFTDAERAALELAEEGTRIADAAGGVSDEVWENAAKHYNEEELVALVGQLVLINAFNRRTVMVQQPAGAYRPGMFGGPPGRPGDVRSGGGRPGAARPAPALSEGAAPDAAGAGSGDVLVAEDALEDLAVGVLRQFVHRLPHLRRLVAGEALADGRLQRGEVGLAALLRHHERADDLAPLLVGQADDRDLGDAVAAQQDGLDLARVDVRRPGDDEVLLAVDDGDEALLVADGDVAGGQVAVRPDRRGGGLRVVQVADHVVRGVAEQLARLARPDLSALLVEELHVGHEPGVPDRPGFAQCVGRTQVRHDARLGGAVDLVHADV